MFRFLFRLYLLVFLACAFSIVFVNYGFLRLFHERLTLEQRQNLNPYVVVLTDYMERQPAAERASALTKLNLLGHDVFTIATPQEVSQLNAEQQRDLRDGKLVLSMDAHDYYLPLPSGMVVRAHTGDDDSNEVAIKAWAYAVLALAVLLSLVIWIHYHWRELRKLEMAARAFGAGSLSTRADISKKSNIYSLSRQFNEMAGQIEASIQHQRDMMNGISHELKTPLARLEFGLALLQSPEFPERQRKRVQGLLNDVHELDDLVTEILVLSRLEQRDAHMMSMQVSVGELLDSIAANVAGEMLDRDLSLTVMTRGAPAHNLIRNSIRYACGTITLGATTGAAGALVLTVEDDGPGIPAAERTRVFEPFHRLDSSRDRHTGGFGLGLAIVKRVALMHGGEVFLEEAASGGARFVLTLPAAAASGMKSGGAYRPLA